MSNGIIKERSQDKETVVFTTESTGEFSMATSENNLEVLSEQTVKEKK